MSTVKQAPWWYGMLSPYDLETTGVNVREDRIVTGFVGTYGPRQIGRERDLSIGARVLINPGVPIPPGATAVHHITDEMARTGGCDPRDGVYAIAKAVADSLKAGIPVVGCNVPYDLSLLYWECLRHGVPTVAEQMGFPPAASVGPIIDALVLDKMVDTYRKGSRKLTALAEHYKVPLDDAHEASADAIAAARVAVAIATKYPDVVPARLADVHAAQKLAAFDQRSGLQRHFRKTDPSKTLDMCWPICTDPTHPAG